MIPAYILVPAAGPGSSLADLYFWNSNNRNKGRLGASIADTLHPIHTLLCDWARVQAARWPVTVRHWGRICGSHVGPCVFPSAAVLRLVTWPGQERVMPYLFSSLYFMTPWPKSPFVQTVPQIPCLPGEPPWNHLNKRKLEITHLRFQVVF